MWLIKLSYMLTRRLIIITARLAALTIPPIVLRILTMFLGLRPVAGLLSNNRLGPTVSMLVRVSCRCRLLDKRWAEWFSLSFLRLITLSDLCICR